MGHVQLVACLAQHVHRIPRSDIVHLSIMIMKVQQALAQAHASVPPLDSSSAVGSTVHEFQENSFQFSGLLVLLQDVTVGLEEIDSCWHSLNKPVEERGTTGAHSVGPSLASPIVFLLLPLTTVLQNTQRGQVNCTVSFPTYCSLC